MNEHISTHDCPGLQITGYNAGLVNTPTISQPSEPGNKSVGQLDKSVRFTVRLKRWELERMNCLVEIRRLDNPSELIRCLLHREFQRRQGKAPAKAYASHFRNGRPKTHKQLVKESDQRIAAMVEEIQKRPDSFIQEALTSI